MTQEKILSEARQYVWRNEFNSMVVSQNDRQVQAFKAGFDFAKECFDLLKDAFERLQQLYIIECKNNPNHILNDKSFIDDWNISAGLVQSSQPLNPPLMTNNCDLHGAFTYIKDDVKFCAHCNEEVKEKIMSKTAIDKKQISVLVKQFLRWYDLSPEENASKSHSLLIRQFIKYYEQTFGNSPSPSK